MIQNCRTYSNISGKSIPTWNLFYSIPMVKLLSSSFNYIIFLVILIVNIVMIEPNDSVSDRFDIKWYEWLLWIWLFSSLVEEVSQFKKEYGYFFRFSNQMDIVMFLLLVVYFVLRILAWSLKRQSLLIWYTDVLVIASIICFIRFMNVFAVSNHIGPLFYVIIRLFKDVGQWLFVFLLFMISFQAGIFAFTRQVFLF